MIDYDRIAADFAASRHLPTAALEPWRLALSPYLPPQSTQPLLDLGAGIGTFSRAFVEWFGVEVLAVEPSEGMRREARAQGLPERVRYLAASAEELPLEDGACGAAWLSNVIHHFRDLALAATNLRRVVAPGGHILVRSVFPDATDGISNFRFFPSARAVVDSFPTVDGLALVMRDAGFHLVERKAISQVICPTLADFYQRAKRRVDTTLIHIPDAEYEVGLEALRAAAMADTSGTPIVDILDLVVFA